MADLILRPSGLDPKLPWALQLRMHDSVGPTEYYTIARVTDQTANMIIEAGSCTWLFGEPDWDAMPDARQKEYVKQLREEADRIERDLKNKGVE